MKVRIDLDGWKLHELVERPTLRIFDQTINIELPCRQINVGCTVCVEHRPLARARLSGRDAYGAPRVRADNHAGFVNLFGPARIILLIEWVVE